jgi:prevent-host-death family protein
MLQINVHDPKIKLADLITAVENGEEILITTDNKTFKIVEVEKPKKKFREFGTAKGQFKISDDFNAPIDDFDEYT